MDFIINMTITTTVTAIGILLIKAIFKNKMSPRLHVLIWIILAIRILVPVLPESQLSIFNFVPMANSTGVEANHIQQPKEEMATTSSIEKGIDKGISESSESNIQSPYKSPEKPFVFTQYLKQNIIILWLAGAALLFCYFICIYLLFSQRIQKKGLYQSDKAVEILNKYKDIMGIKRNVAITRYGETPMLKGIFRPMMSVPKNYDAMELEYAIIHELCHLKYHDIETNLISTILLCLNWYNPIIWVCHSVFRRDIEILCDQRVLEVTSNKKEYATLLLKACFEGNPILPGTTCMNSSKKEIKSRIYFMANYRKPATVWIIVMVVLVGLLGTGCLFNKTGEDLNSLVRNDSVKHRKSLEGSPELGTTTPPSKKNTLQEQSATMDSKGQYVQSSKVVNLELLTISIPDSFRKGETKTYTCRGDDFEGADQFAGWEGTFDSIQYICSDTGLELNIFITSLSEDTAREYLEPLITEEYNSKIERLKIMEAQTGSFFNQALANVYPFNEIDLIKVGGGRVLTSEGLPSTRKFYAGNEVQENYGFMVDGREYITRYGALGYDLVYIFGVYSGSEALALCEDILKTVIPAPDVTMCGVRR